MAKSSGCQGSEARVVERHKATGANQLDLEVGEVILVIEKHKSGWWGGKKRGSERKGWFPSSVVSEISESDPLENSCSVVEPFLCSSLGIKEADDKASRVEVVTSSDLKWSLAQARTKQLHRISPRNQAAEDLATLKARLLSDIDASRAENSAVLPECSVCSCIMNSKGTDDMAQMKRLLVQTRAQHLQDAEELATWKARAEAAQRTVDKLDRELGSERSCREALEFELETIRASAADDAAVRQLMIKELEEARSQASECRAQAAEAEQKVKEFAFKAAEAGRRADEFAAELADFSAARERVTLEVACPGSVAAEGPCCSLRRTYSAHSTLVSIPAETQQETNCDRVQVPFKGYRFGQGSGTQPWSSSRHHLDNAVGNEQRGGQSPLKKPRSPVRRTGTVGVRRNPSPSSPKRSGISVSPPQGFRSLEANTDSKKAPTASPPQGFRSLEANTNSKKAPTASPPQGFRSLESTNGSRADRRVPYNQVSPVQRHREVKLSSPAASPQLGYRETKLGSSAKIGGG